jgi:hypothetical protein
LLTNVGNASFLNHLKQRILNFLAAHPWIDGVYFDNGALIMAQYGTSYPVYDQNHNLLWSNDTYYQKAQMSFMSNVAAALKARDTWLVTTPADSSLAIPAQTTAIWRSGGWIGTRPTSPPRRSSTGSSARTRTLLSSAEMTPGTTTGTAGRVSKPRRRLDHAHVLGWN